MNIIEALKLNETERVKSSKNEIGYVWNVGEMKTCNEFNITQITAEWSVIPKTVTITREQLAVIWNSVDSGADEKHYTACDSRLFTNIADRLGL